MPMPLAAEPTSTGREDRLTDALVQAGVEFLAR